MKFTNVSEIGEPRREASERTGFVSGFCLIFLAMSVAGTATIEAQAPRLKALIVDGQNNHSNWPETTRMMKSYLVESGLFKVEVATTATEGIDETFEPAFSSYDVVVSNYNGSPWPEPTRAAFVEYMSNGGGLVVVHAADNAFPEWSEYNQMIGLGGWGGRNQAAGPYLYFDEQAGAVVRDDRDGAGGSHGQQHSFQIIVREPEHPVTRGMPRAWMHANDELYDQLRGPAENMTLLATAFSETKTGGSGRHEPILMTVAYDLGRVFHLPLGHGNDSQECVGFIVTFQRAAEWAATGEVTQTIPDDFPGMYDVSVRPFEKSDEEKPRSPGRDE